MAARRYFRKGEEDLPRGGAFRYRGTQVVTGAEARKLAEEEAAAQRRAEGMAARQAAEEAARRRAAEELLRSRAPGSAPPRTAFGHDPLDRAPGVRAAADPRPASASGSSSAGVRPTGPRSTAGPDGSRAPGTSTAADGSVLRPSLLRRMRRALGREG
jgi:hypothetical protein